MSWLYRIDPAYDPDGEVPGSAIAAAAECDADGNVIGPWQPNPNYRPSLLAQLLERFPSDRFLVAFGAFLRGESSLPEFRRTFEETEFDVLTTPDRTSLLVVDLGNGPAFALVSTPELFGDGERPPSVRMPGTEVLSLASDRAGFVIDSSPLGAIWLPLADLAAA